MDLSTQDQRDKSAPAIHSLVEWRHHFDFLGSSGKNLGEEKLLNNVSIL